jgi:hypothetical protein
LLIREWWRWPTIAYLPGKLEKDFSLYPWQAQVISGLCISTIDTGLVTPFERWKIRAITGTLPPKQDSFYKNLSRIVDGGWNGFAPFWYRTSIGWVFFSTSQRYLRDKYKIITQKKDLNILDLAVIGTALGTFMSITMAPLDYANTVSQSRDVSMKSIFRTAIKMKKMQVIKLLWRGLPLQFVISSIQCFTSVALIEEFY